MKNTSAFTLNPRRTTLVEECYALLYDAIESGRWKDAIPSERDLCAEMDVSRPTLRAALLKLEAEGILSKQGLRRRTVSRTSKAKPRKQNIVCLLSPIEISSMQEHDLIWLNELRMLLGNSNYVLRVLVRPGIFTKQTNRVMEVISQDTVTACWILYRSNLALQKWFLKNDKASQVVVVGSTHPGIELSSVDMDHRAVCRHAATMLMRLNHHRICYIGSSKKHAGDLCSEEGFLDAFSRVKGDEFTPLFAHHDGSVDVIVRTLDGILNMARRPTAFVVANSNHVLTIMTHLACRGWIAGRDYALLARDYAPFYEHLVPSIACYSNTPKSSAKEVARIIISHAKGITNEIITKRTIPDLIRGDSLCSIATQ
ncbi:substrate-binding domain-containing protein [Coraliomargarita parva]|uniref:substrate-binding domain-containing protein n=1 Tax=Coraliomargarita parva TaxID=3014050 RepID=UPI0022B3A3A8|nr:substrate-binding domain-containing protein [Coraliomargarita parva]